MKNILIITIRKIKEDEILGSVIPLRGTTGADGKQYDMFCLPLQYIFGWLFTINPQTFLNRFNCTFFHLNVKLQIKSYF